MGDIVRKYNESFAPALKNRKINGVVAGKTLSVDDLKRVSYFEDKIYYCCQCNGKWQRKDKLKWIACDTCNKVYVNCTNLDFDDEESLDVDEIDYNCC